MKVLYTVHRASTQTAEVEAKLKNGQSVLATMQGVEVELIAQNAEHGTTKLWFNDAADAKDFVEGRTIQGEFTLVAKEK